MKVLSEKRALALLKRLKNDLRGEVSAYERRAADCATCDTPGACCLDEHFVNVRISRLEAVAIAGVIEQTHGIRRAALEERIANAAGDLLSSAGSGTFACPLYEKGTGCLVHDDAKPAPCIHHACYASPEDLPPDELQNAAELAIHRLNERVYGRSQYLQPIPVAVQRAISRL